MRYIYVHVLLLLSFSIGLTAQDFTYKISKEVLQRLETEKKIPVIIKFADQNVRQHIVDHWTKEAKTHAVYRHTTRSAQNQAAARTVLKQANVDHTSYTIVNAIALEASKEILQRMVSLGDVTHVYYDARMMRQQTVEQRPSVGTRSVEPEWGIKMIGADSVWKMGYEGKGVVIAGQDTGYDWDVSPLKKKYRGWSADGVDHNYNWHDAIKQIDSLHQDDIPDPKNNPCGLQSKVPCDDHNHGTHTMGTMVGSDDNNKIGVAPQATWIGCRNMERGYGRISTYLECFEWFLAPYDLEGKNPDPSKAPHVINNSWGCIPKEGCNPSNFKILEEAVDKLKAAGIVVVVSAGNNGPSCGTINSPAAIYENSFVVGSTTSEDTISNFSSRGVVTVDKSMRLKPNISAPGSGVRSVLVGGKYAAFSGTSMAGPHVAGVVALMISANPSLAGKVDLIEEIIESTAVPKYTTQECGGHAGSEVPNATFGYGRIDAVAAVEKAINTAVSVKEESIEGSLLSVYPVPSTDFVIITSQAEIKDVTIYGMDGRLINKKAATNTQECRIDIRNLQKGMYTVCASTSSGRQCSKLVKVEGK